MLAELGEGFERRRRVFLERFFKRWSSAWFQNSRAGRGVCTEVSFREPWIYFELRRVSNGVGSELRRVQLGVGSNGGGGLRTAELGVGSEQQSWVRISVLSLSIISLVLWVLVKASSASDLWSKK